MVYANLDTTAVLAWSPQAEKSIIACGTVAGAMDATFSSTSTLHFYDILGYSKDSSSSTSSIASISASGRYPPLSLLSFFSPSQFSSPYFLFLSSSQFSSPSLPSLFHRLAWSNPIQNRPHGILAGGLENGQISVWDPKEITDSNDISKVSPIFNSSDHTGAVAGLQFNPFQNNLLASGAANGEILIWDALSDFKSYSPGARSSRIEDVTDLSWNNQVQQILATSSNSGSTAVWDLRNRREVMNLAHSGNLGLDLNQGMNSSNGMSRSGVSAVKWHPNSPTQLVTSLDDDKTPVILAWDLRNAKSPTKFYSGHNRGILSLSWCLKDPSLLLSSGKDNR
ncbi:Protein transport protein SEC31, partial [Smittium culicis]